MSSIVLYDLATADREIRPGPFCWLAKFALLHKGLDFETVALGFLPKSDYPDPEYGKLPMLKDGDILIRDSAEIIKHLEANYPDQPLVAEGEGAARLERVQQWLGNTLFPVIAPMMFLRIHNLLPPEEQAYFRKTREARFSITLEEGANDKTLPGKVTAAFEEMATELGERQWFGGDDPDLSDYTIAGILMWQRCVTRDRLYDMPASMEAWFARVRALFDGYGDKAKSA